MPWRRTIRMRRPTMRSGFRRSSKADTTRRSRSTTLLPFVTPLSGHWRAFQATPAYDKRDDARSRGYAAAALARWTGGGSPGIARRTGESVPRGGSCRNSGDACAPRLRRFRRGPGGGRSRWRRIGRPRSSGSSTNPRSIRCGGRRAFRRSSTASDCPRGTDAGRPKSGHLHGSWHTCKALYSKPIAIGR